MSQSDVFRPTNGPLLVRGTLTQGIPMPMDSYRKDSGRRPSTQSGYRFGQLSHNSFFARHNPHPARVRHIKGLLDVPICSVSDDGFISNPRYTLQFPPNNFDQTKLKTCYSKYYNLPVNAINVNSQKHPINTITGLQWFMGKSLNNRIFREKAIPQDGLVPQTDAWRDELHALAEAAGLYNQQNMQNGRPAAGHQQDVGRPKSTPDGRPRTTQYSQTTGRLIPPPSRAMSRQSTRQGTRDGYMNNFQGISEDPDVDSAILQMLCQILQTDDISAAQSWLVGAQDQEKALVLDMIRAAVGSNEEYYKHGAEPEHNAVLAESGTQTNGFGPQPGEDMDRQVDRLSLADPDSRPGSKGQGDGSKYLRYTYSAGGEPAGGRLATPNAMQRNAIPEDKEAIDVRRTPVNREVFRSARSRSRQSERPPSRAKSPSRLGSAFSMTSEPKLRYTTTPVPDQNIALQKQSLQNGVGNGEPTWNQEQSTQQY